MRHDELDRPHEMRRDPQQDLALGERLGDQAELVVLEVAQAAVDQLAAARGGRGAEIALLAEEDSQAPAGRVARDAGAVDPAADDDEVVALGRGRHASAARIRSSSASTNAASW